ncbi:CTP synthase [Mycoplasmopsis agassizii]|uniref:CTP synthase n=1 Tax=Mycoplasmopsis agassizii TaxID=33922 RepID=UPI003528646C
MDKKTRYIFVTGGVISGLGKGISAASIGNILKARGFSIFVLKLDPYLNIDPGVMSPYEHGEVYVTKDGGETDLDLGHYERFIDVELTKDSNWTSGRIYKRLFEKERNGDYKGKTVQVIPHLTDEITKIIHETADKYQPDFMIIEVGGTIGDIESDPFIEAISKMKFNHYEDVFLAMVTYIPYLSSSNEFKSKPTQVSLLNLRSRNLSPNLVLLRNEKLVPHDIMLKIASKTNLHLDEIIAIPDLENIYFAPQYFERTRVADVILKYFKIEPIKADFSEWENLIDLIKAKKTHQIHLVMIGKYVEFHDAYKSIIEALKIASYHTDVELKLTWKDSSRINDDNKRLLKAFYDGVVILPGFGRRGFEGKVTTALYTREIKMPTLGICLGMQAMSVAQARLKGYKNATSAEFATRGADEVFVLNILEGKDKEKNLGGTLRLGNYDVKLLEGSLAHKAYEKDLITERHRHRYEITEEFKEILQDEEFVFSGINPETNLAEIAEVKNHPFYLGTQYHPEFTNRPLKGHSLFMEFLKAIIREKEKEENN